MTRQEYRGMRFGECEMLWLIKMAIIIFCQKNIAKIRFVPTGFNLDRDYPARPHIIISLITDPADMIKVFM